MFVVFVDKISRHGHGEEVVRFGNVRLLFLLYVDDVVLFASSDHDLHCALEQFAAMCEATGLRGIVYVLCSGETLGSPKRSLRVLLGSGISGFLS